MKTIIVGADLNSSALWAMLDLLSRSGTIVLLDEAHMSIDQNSAPLQSLRDADFTTVHRLPEPEIKASNWKDRKSKGEKKRQRSEWNRSMRGKR